MSWNATVSRDRETGPLPTAGLIVPPAHGRVPSHGPELYEGSLHFLAAGLGLRAMSIDGYDAVISRVGDLSRELAGAGADGVVLMGTSLSFYRGTAFDLELVRTMEEASGRPSTTMSQAIVAGLKAVGADRVAVATAYTSDVNERLCRYLDGSELGVAAVEGLGVVDTGAAQVIPVQDVRDVADRAMSSALEAGRSVDALLISCGALDTLDLVPELEQRHGVPVVASSPAGFWAAARLVGIDPRVHGRGVLFTRDG